MVKWRYYENCEGFSPQWVIEDEHGRFIGYVETEADAKRIAKAPEMVALLEEEDAEYQCGDHECDLCTRRAAILAEIKGGDEEGV